MQHQESLQSYQHMYTDFAMNTPKAAAYLNRFNVEKSPETEEGNGRRVRTAFTEPQLQELEREFVENGAFLLPIRRTQIASRLGLREKQIKIWFQNRRMKAKKATGILPNGNKIVKPKPPKKRLPVIKPLVAEIIGNPAIKRKRDFNPQVLVQVPANQTLPRLPETVQIEQEQIQQIRWVVVDTPYLAQQQKQPPILMPAQPPILIPAQPPISMPAQPQQLLSQTEAECEVQTLLNESSFAEYLTPHPSGFQQGNVPASAPQIQQPQQQFHIQQGHIQQEPYFQVTNQQEIVQHQTEHHQPASSMFSEGEFNVGEFIDSFDKYVDETKDQEFTLNETQIAENFNLDLADLEIDDLLNLSRSDIMDLSFLSEPEPPTPTITISFEDLMNPTMKISS